MNIRATQCVPFLRHLALQPLILPSVLPMVLLIALLIALLIPQPAQAGDVPGFDQPVSLMPRDQPIGQFIKDLFSRIGVPVQIDESIRGAVNGDFNKSARAVFDDLMISFQLTLYYDGAVAFVYPADDIVHKVVYMPGTVGQQVVSNAASMKLVDKDNLVALSSAGLVVTGTQRFVEQIQELGDVLQQGTQRSRPSDTYRVFSLRYAWADDVTMSVGGQEVIIPGVASLLRRLIEPGSIAAPPSVTRQRLSPTEPGLRGQGLQSVGKTEAGSASAIDDSNAQQLSSGGSTGNTRIVADSRQNAIIIRDQPDRMAGYEALIRSLDVESQMVEIEATIIDMNTDRLRELGVNWRAQSNDFEALVGQGNITSDQSLQSQLSGFASFDRGGIISLVLGDESEFISRIQALETQGAARIVSKPHVITLSNVEALLDTTSTFFVRVAGQEEVDLFNVSVGTSLRVTPHVVDGADQTHIKLLVSVEDGSATDRTVDQIPVVERSSINTQAVMNVGESLLIGGLVREVTSNSTSKVPLLGSIPAIGALFRSNSKQSQRIERLFLISPRLNLRDTGEEMTRLDVPILSGTESEILTSNSGRLDEANQALALRDQNRTLVQPLPLGQSNIGLTREGVEPAVRRTQENTFKPAPRPSIRQRLPGSEPQLLTAEQPAPLITQDDNLLIQSQTPRAEQQAAPLDGNSNAEGWQEVGGSSVAVSADAEDIGGPELDINEWQTIGQ